MLGGWLHRRTWHVATTLMRNERRRQNRERQAAEMNTLQDHAEGQLSGSLPCWTRPSINWAPATGRRLCCAFSSIATSAPSARRWAATKTPRKSASAALWKNCAAILSAGHCCLLHRDRFGHRCPRRPRGAPGLASAVTTASLTGAAGSSSFGSHPSAQNHVGEQNHAHRSRGYSHRHRRYFRFRNKKPNTPGPICR